MNRINKIIKILKDGERDFKLEPDRAKNNYEGLCFYIRCHQLLAFSTERTKKLYIKTILKDMDDNHYHFTNTSSQEVAWFFKVPGYKTERANWCSLELKEIQKRCLHPLNKRYYQPAEPKNNVPEDYYCLLCNKQLPFPEPIEEKLCD